MKEIIWEKAEKQFFCIPHLLGQTMLIKKQLRSHDTILYVYYYYIQSTIDGFQRLIITSPLHKPKLIFNYQLHMITISESL